MNRIDRIKIQPDINNLIDINTNNKGSLIFDNYNYPIDHSSWNISSQDPNIHDIIKLVNIVGIDNFSSQISILKDIKYLFRNEIRFVSHATLHSYFKIFRYFFKFINSQINLNITSIEQINFEILLIYKEFLKTQNGAYDKYTRLINVLKSMKKYKDHITLSSDILDSNYPISGFKNNKKELSSIPLYSQDEFKSMFKLMNDIITEYLNGNEEIPEKTFVSCSYWFIAFCTGFNETALKYLTINSFEITINDNTKTYCFIGKKNRSSKGYQTSNVSFNISGEIHIFDKVINKLLTLNKKYRHLVVLPDDIDSLFIHEPYERNNKTYQIYRGSVSSMLENPIYREYTKKYNVETLMLSTRKIRNQWTNEIFDLAKSEQLVSSMLGHQNMTTTINHYMKNNLSQDVLFKFNLIQRLMDSFSKNNKFDDWIDFQNNFNVKNSSITEIIENLKNGIYSTGMATCFITESNKNSTCSNYIQCFECEHFSVIGERDLWKIMSFRESIIEISKDDSYTWLIETINNILKNFDKKIIIEARNKLKSGRHPFWKNNIMAEQMIIKYEHTK